MAFELELPDIGEGLAEAEIVQWLVAPGEAVTEDQPLVEVETDKAVVEVPSPVEGTILELRAEPGEVVAVGEVIVVVDTDGGEPSPEADAPETMSDAEPTPAVEDPGAGVTDSKPAESEGADTGRGGTTTDGPTFAPPSVRRLARELEVDLAEVAGSGSAGRITEADVRAAAAAHGETAESPDADTGVADATGDRERDDTSTGVGRRTTTDRSADTDRSAGTDHEPIAAAGREKTLAAPATRGVARELGVDINDVPAVEHREEGAFVTADAVREYATSERDTGTSEETLHDRAAVPAGPTESAGQETPIERIPYKGLRRTIGNQMERSKFTAPHVSSHIEADVQRLVDVHGDLAEHAERSGVELTYLPFIMKAVVSALKTYPDFNAELDEENEEILRKRYYNIGIATATEEGLMVPVVDNVDEKGLLELAEEIEELAERARDRTISREEMQGGTFTISNFGPIGGEYATPIINYPESAILGLGQIDQRPRVVDSEVVPRYTLPVSLSFDHRIADGATAGHFINHLVERLEDPSLLLLSTMDS